MYYLLEKKNIEIFHSMLFISGKQDKMSSWDKQFDQLSISDDQIELIFTSDKWLQINKKDTAVVEKPPLTATRWHQFKGTVQKQEVQAFRMNEVNIGYCCEDVFDFIVQCNNLARFVIYTIQDSDSDRDIVTGLIRVLPRLNKLKNIQIWDVNMGSEGSNVISSVNSPDLRIFSLYRTGLSGAGSSLTSALHRFPHLSYLDLFDSGLNKDESLSVLNTLPSSCPNIVYLSIWPAKFTSEEIKPIYKRNSLNKLVGVSLHFETIDDWLTSLGQFYQPLEMLYLTVGGDPAIGNELNRFISMISSYTKLCYLKVNNDVLNYEGEDRVRKVMTRKGGKLAVWPKDSHGCKEYNEQIDKVRNKCMSS